MVGRLLAREEHNLDSSGTSLSASSEAPLPNCQVEKQQLKKKKKKKQKDSVPVCGNQSQLYEDSTTSESCGTVSAPRMSQPSSTPFSAETLLSEEMHYGAQVLKARLFESSKTPSQDSCGAILPNGEVEKQHLRKRKKKKTKQSDSFQVEDSLSKSDGDTRTSESCGAPHGKLSSDSGKYAFDDLLSPIPQKRKAGEQDVLKPASVSRAPSYPDSDVQRRKTKKRKKKMLGAGSHQQESWRSLNS